MKLLLSSASLALFFGYSVGNCSDARDRNDAGNQSTRGVHWEFDPDAQACIRSESWTARDRPPTPYPHDDNLSDSGESDSIFSSFGSWGMQPTEEFYDSIVEGAPKSILRKGSIHTMTIPDLCLKLKSPSTDATELDSVIAALLKKDCAEHQQEIGNAIYQRMGTEGLDWADNLVSWRRLCNNCLSDERMDSPFSQIIHK